jgi:putative redox protein
MSAGGTHEVVIRTGPGFRTEVEAGRHRWVLDEPVRAGGTDEGPTPYDQLNAAIGACTAMTLRIYADRKGWPLEEVVVRLRHGRQHETDCEKCETEAVGIERIDREIELRGELTEEQRSRLLAIADRCPVKQTLERGLKIAPAVASVGRDQGEGGRTGAPASSARATGD